MMNHFTATKHTAGTTTAPAFSSCGSNQNFAIIMMDIACAVSIFALLVLIALLGLVLVSALISLLVLVLLITKIPYRQQEISPA